MARRAAPLILLLSLVLLSTSCAASLYKVKPVAELPPLPTDARSTEVDSLTLRVAPLLSDEESQELFEANLQVSGVLPVRIELDAKTVVELKKARFHVRDNQGKDWKLVSSKKAVSAIMKANGILAYNPNFRKQFEKDFGAYELDLKTPLANGDKRSGFLFFRTPDKRPVPTATPLTLTIDRLPQTVSVSLR